MKKVLAICLIATLLVGCTSSTQFGPCVGFAEQQNPKLTYKVSGWNLAMGIIFFELIVPPIIVATDETLCPNGTK